MTCRRKLKQGFVQCFYNHKYTKKYWRLRSFVSTADGTIATCLYNNNWICLFTFNFFYFFTSLYIWPSPHVYIIIIGYAYSLLIFSIFLPVYIFWIKPEEIKRRVWFLDIWLMLFSYNIFKSLVEKH